MIICRNCTQTFNSDSTKVESVECCPKCFKSYMDTIFGEGDKQ